MIVTDDIDTSQNATNEIAKDSGLNTKQAVFPVDLRKAAQGLGQENGRQQTSKQDSANTAGLQSFSGIEKVDSSETGNVKVYQPNPLQSFVILFCVSLTLGSGVAATVLHRTGELPVPHWPVFWVQFPIIQLNSLEI